MTRFLALTLGSALFTAAPVSAQTTWTIDPNHSAAQFSVRHMMVSTVRGNLGKITGTVTFDGKNVEGISAEATIDATGIDTRVESRDNDLRSADFFDVAKYPTITFKSKRAEPGGEGHFKLVGDLTMHGVTKEVVLDVEGPSPAVKQGDGERIGAVATTKLNRRDYGLNYSRMLEAGGVVVGDEISVTLDIELTRKLAATQ